MALINKFCRLASVVLLITTYQEAKSQKAQESNPPTAQAPSPAPATQAPPSNRSQMQEPEPVYETATVLKATTRLVVVDVVATDKDGRPVTDLRREDFVLLEDGKEQKVRVFSLRQPSPDSNPNSKLPPAELPKGVFTNVPRYSNENALNVVLLDALNTNASDQTYVRDEMIKYLRKIPEGRPIAVYLLGSKLTLLHDFTTDPALLQNAVQKLHGKFSLLLDNPTGGPAPAVLSDIPGQNPDSVEVQFITQFEQEHIGLQTDLRVHSTLAAFKAIAHAVAGYPGRKNLVWISAAFPLSIDPNVQIKRDIFAGNRSYLGEIASAADALMDAQVAIYPIDARGLAPYSIFDTATRGYDQFGVGHLDSPDPSRLAGGAINAESAALQEIHAGMKEMAERTGGRAFYDRNDIDEAMHRSIEDGSTYYTLAYYPVNKDWNGRFRKIQIRNERPGIRLRYRLGYYAVDPRSFAELSPKEQARAFGDALKLDSPAATGLPFHAGVVAPSDRTANKVLVNFAVDAHAISFESASDGLQHAEVECVVQAYLLDGKWVKTESSLLKAALNPEMFKKAMQENRLFCQQSVGLPPASYLLRLGVRDNHTGLMGTANARVTVAPVPAVAKATNK